MKRRIFWSVFTIFLSLQIYDAIAAIFWKSASYVCFERSQFWEWGKSSATKNLITRMNKNSLH